VIGLAGLKGGSDQLPKMSHIIASDEASLGVHLEGPVYHSSYGHVLLFSGKDPMIA
jgi:hypothetical protein